MMVTYYEWKYSGQPCDAGPYYYLFQTVIDEVEETTEITWLSNHSVGRGVTRKRAVLTKQYPAVGHGNKQ